jgi:hypothetical protein
MLGHDSWTDAGDREFSQPMNRFGLSGGLFGSDGGTAMLSRRSLLALLAVVPIACQSPNPLLYTLTVVPGAERPAPCVREVAA